MTRSASERGLEAAKAYLERAGLNVLDDAGEVDLIAVEGDVTILCDVVTRKSYVAAQSPSKALIKRAHATAKRLGLAEWRLDVISILVISEDRALLRHQRAAYDPQRGA